MEPKITKVDENNVAVISEARQIHSKADLEMRKTLMLDKIAKIDLMLAVLSA